MDYILKSVALYTGMQQATSEGEFQQLLAADDALNDAHRNPRFAFRTLTRMKSHDQAGGGFSTPGPKLPKS